MTRALTYFASLLFAVALSLSAPAQGQLRRVLDLNRQAMDAYTNLEVEQAMDLLQQALQNAQSRGVTGVPLANTYANLGIVAVGGFGDNASGLQHFMNALREDSNVQLDPLNSTPDIQSVFLLARNRVGGNGGGNTRPPPRPAAPGEIPHSPVREQTANTAIPIFVEVPDGAPVSGITVHYQAPGMRIFRAVEMQRMQGGFGLELPCAEVFAPRVSYYLEAFDDDGDRIGTAGSPDSPFAVEVVSSLSGPPPALPGQSPPSVCGESECPPGMDCGGGGGGTAGLGDTCINSSECRSGLTCEDNFCVSGGGGGGGDDDEPIDDGDMPRFFIDAGFTVGFGYASSGSRADTNDEVRDPTTNQPTTPSFIGPGVGDCPDEGFDCVRLEQPGFLTTLALRVTTGYWIIPRFALAATLRFQLNAGEGSLSNLLLGLRGMYQLTAPSGDGLNANVFLGTSVGQIQLQPGQNGEEEPFMVSGLNGVQLGGNIGYRFTRNIGVTFTPEVHLLFPQFLFNLDLTVSVSASF